MPPTSGASFAAAPARPSNWKRTEPPPDLARSDIDDIASALTLLFPDGHAFAVAGVRGESLLASAVAQPHWPHHRAAQAKAAALHFSLNKNHAFVDGNKRIAVTAMEWFLVRNGFELHASNDDIVAFALAVERTLARGEQGMVHTPRQPRFVVVRTPRPLAPRISHSPLTASLDPHEDLRGRPRGSPRKHGTLMNRLATETSPYLLQHAANPVDWYPWGDEAFTRARAEDRPILLSVGYSSCHWCHVMAHESFEHPSTAALMNEGFVNIKVDREERPDVDAVYMTATQALTGQGGWPMTVFLTPQGEPFYAGTYFPPDDRYGRPGFPAVLEAVRRAWDTDRAKVLESAAQIAERLKAAAAHSIPARDLLDTSATAEAVRRLSRTFDRAFGGWGRAPKFPSPGVLDFLLIHSQLSPDSPPEDGPPPLDMALETLRRMANGGIYDHLGGGFARYSTDARWLVPHFEKMLYDNAQLARIYLHASLVAPTTEDRARFEAVTRETLDYLAREMLSPEGGFYSAQDADSEGVEGRFFVWTPAEVQAALGPEDARLFNAWFDVTANGNFEDPHHPELGRSNVLSTPRPLPEVAADLAIPETALAARLPELRARMLAARNLRVRPGLDDKALTSWNGLALAAFAEAGRVLDDARYLDIARRNATFLRAQLWRDGRLLHTATGGVARVDAMLEDYAFLGLGLVALYRATGDIEHLRWARQLFEVLQARCFDPESRTFFDTPRDGEPLLFRQRPLQDGPLPSGNAAAALLAFWLGRYFERPDWEALGRGIAGAALAQLAEYPSAIGGALQLATLARAPRRELAIVGPAPERAPFEATLATRYLPALVLAPGDTAADLPLFEGRGAPGTALAYLCEDMVCGLPARTPEQLRTQLDALS